MGNSCVVNILNKNKSIGTGFFVSAQGHIITCKHVLEQVEYFDRNKIFYFRDNFKNKVHKARLVSLNSKTDIAVLKSDFKTNNFYRFYDTVPIGHRVCCYGFPNGSSREIKDTVLFENITNDGSVIQLSEANNITMGFSGAPVVFENFAIGIVTSITKTDTNGRLSNVAFAISAKKILESLSKFVSKINQCIGYGEKEEKCNNLAFYAYDGLCEDCYNKKFFDLIISLFKSQNYSVHSYDGYFISELKYGAYTYKDIVFILTKNGEKITKDELLNINEKIEENDCCFSQKMIVTNTGVDDRSLSFLKKHQIEIITKEKLIRTLFDFENYKTDLTAHVNSEQLAKHYIDVYSLNPFPGKEENEFDFYNEEDAFEDDFEFLDLDDDWDYVEFEPDLDKEDSQTNHHSYLTSDFDQANKVLLKDYVDTFIESNSKALLILGDYGTGKTSFCYNYSLNLLKKFMEEDSLYLPLLIKLRGYNKAVDINQLLTDYFVNKLNMTNFNISSLKLLLKNINVVLIFDGYDEVAKKVDFDVKFEVLKEICEFAEPKTKIILTCRPNFFQNATEFNEIFQKSYFHYEPGDKPLLNFIENSISELTPNQIKKYINSYSDDLEKFNLSVDDMLKTISNTHDLTDLAKRPFLLYMILQTLPEILKDMKEKGNRKINAAKLYEIYTDNWIKREERKNKTLIRRTEKEIFCKEIAFELYCTDATSLSYTKFPETIKKHFKQLQRIEDIDYFTHDIQSCSFLTSDMSGEFKFIHKSFMEYFVADLVVSKLKKISFHDEEVELISNLNSVIGVTYFSSDICFFINDIIEISSKNKMKKFLPLFKKLNEISQSNLVSIFSKTQENMSNFLLEYEVSNLVIKHSDLSKSNFVGNKFVDFCFSNINLFSTVFSGVTFINCDFSGAVFNNASLSECTFINCDFYSSTWKSCSVNKCLFKTECFNSYDKSYFDDDLTNYINCSNFENSLWKNVSILESHFIGCNILDSNMSSVIIHDCIFNQVDFSGTKIFGKLNLKNNTLIDTTGEPYEL